ncbi:hypothetical protein [Streptomyces sp. NPDC018045]|uniref:nSTAND1 domain-containing NTPase n=1 Tax=Streptomyces sp. NPDC018045 TaxID=3365037 RepID=UPI003789D4D8
MTDPPYRGLARFEPGDHARFFGRTRLTDSLMSLVRTCRCVMVLGPSGSGKSSLLRAGLIPRLQSAQEPALRPAAIRILTPGPRPVHEHRKLFTPAAGAGDTWLVVDQFEEIFTLCSDPGARREFIDLLLSARNALSRLRVVVGVRADFYARCLEYEGLVETLATASLPVGSMTADELREVIVKPAATAGLIVERALTARLLKETSEEPGALPLLSHTLLETWRRRRGRALTLEGYQAAGGIHGAIARTAEDLYTRLTPPQAAAARRILLRMITPGEGAQDTRRPLAHSETRTGHPADRAAALEALARSRLITVDDENADIAHEALITSWPRLSRWIEEDRERLVAHRKLTEAAQAWDQLQRDPGALYRGTRLSAAKDLFASPRHRAHLTPLEDAFLQASLGAAQRQTRRTRQLIAALSTLLVLALAATTFAVQKAFDADAQRRLAVSRELAARAEAMTGQHPEAAMLLALQGYRQAPTVEARSSLLSSYAGYYANQLTGHTDVVDGVAFSPDGRTLATASYDHSVKIWDTRSHRLIATLTGHTDSVNDLAFSPDGRVLATAGNDRSIKLWDTRTYRTTATLTGHTNMVEGVAFSPDGRTLASASSDRTTRLWNVTSHRMTATLAGQDEAVMRVAFSPDGRTLATAGGERTTRLWDVASHRMTATLAGRNEAVMRVAFSPDGRTLATASSDRGVTLWDTRSHRQSAALTGHTQMVQDVAFSPDGRVLATASSDRSARLWDLRTHRPLAAFTGNGAVHGVAFSPDGRVLATAGQDHTVHLWNTASHRKITVLTGRSGIATSTAFADGSGAQAAFDYLRGVARWTPKAPGPAMPRIHSSPLEGATTADGRILATADKDGTVRLWNMLAGRQTTTLRGPPGVIRSMAFSGDNRTLITCGADGTIRRWDLATSRTTATLTGAPGTTTAVAVSPDGRTVATAGIGGTTRLWAVDSHRMSATLKSHSYAIAALAFSPDGRTLATAGTDSTTRLWATASHRRLATLTGHTNALSALAFSPDGRTLATAGTDHTARLWDLRSRQTTAVLTGHTDAVLKVMFSPDGRTLATRGQNGTARLWSTDIDDVATRICGLSRANHWPRLLAGPTVKELCPQRAS